MLLIIRVPLVVAVLAALHQHGVCALMWALG